MIYDNVVFDDDVDGDGDDNNDEDYNVNDGDGDDDNMNVDDDDDDDDEMEGMEWFLVYMTFYPVKKKKKIEILLIFLSI